ncbi:hypothetical protein ACHAWT_000165, partial [Skeletonema menzelii]
PGGHHDLIGPAGGDGLLNNNQHHPLQGIAVGNHHQHVVAAPVHRYLAAGSLDDGLLQNHPAPPQVPPPQDPQDALIAGNQHGEDGLHIPVSLLRYKNSTDPIANSLHRLLGDGMRLNHNAYQTEKEAEQGITITSTMAGERALNHAIKFTRSQLRYKVKHDKVVCRSVQDLGINLPPTMSPADFLTDNNAIATIFQALLGKMAPFDAFIKLVKVWAVVVVMPFSERNGDTTLQSELRASFLRSLAEECGLAIGSVHFDFGMDPHAENIIDQFIRKHVMTPVVRNLAGRKDKTADKERFWLSLLRIFFPGVSTQNTIGLRVCDALPRQIPDNGYVSVVVPFLAFTGFNLREPFHVHIISNVGSNLENVLRSLHSPMPPPSGIVLRINSTSGDSANSSLTNTFHGAQAQVAQPQPQVAQAQVATFSQESIAEDAGGGAMTAQVSMSNEEEEVNASSEDEASPSKGEQELQNATEQDLLSDTEGGSFTGSVEDALSSDEELAIESAQQENGKENETEASIVDDSALASNKQDDADALSSSSEELERGSKRKSREGVDGGRAHKVIKTGEAEKSSNSGAADAMSKVGDAAVTVWPEATGWPEAMPDPPTLGSKNSNPNVHVPCSTEGSKGGPVTCPVMICDGCLTHWLGSVGSGRSGRMQIYKLHCTIEKCQCQGEELGEY